MRLGHLRPVNRADILCPLALQNKLEAQYAMKLEAALNDASDLKQQLELKAQENKSVTATLDTLRGNHAELERAFKITAAGIEGGKSLAESAKDMERVRKTMAAQLAEFDTMKKSLMRDLQNRCEKVRERGLRQPPVDEQLTFAVPTGCRTRDLAR